MWAPSRSRPRHPPEPVLQAPLLARAPERRTRLPRASTARAWRCSRSSRAVQCTRPQWAAKSSSTSLCRVSPLNKGRVSRLRATASAPEANLNPVLLMRCAHRLDGQRTLPCASNASPVRRASCSRTMQRGMMIQNACRSFQLIARCRISAASICISARDIETRSLVTQ